jgi:hypothetical protein
MVFCSEEKIFWDDIASLSAKRLFCARVGLIWVVLLTFVIRVKELTKEAAKKANGSGNLANQTQTIGPSGVFAQNGVQPCASRAPSSDVHRSPVVQSSVPSLFHPSNIQCTSTPVKPGSISKRTVSQDLDRVLLNGVNEMPISGHKLTRESPEEDLHMGRLSPITNSPRALHHEDDVQHCQSPVIVEAGNTGRQNLVFTGRSSPDVPLRNSPCSCRSADDLSAVCRMSQLTIDRAAFSVHRHITSEHSEPHALFAEVKTCMENARANIRNFLQGEKKPSQPSNAANGGLAEHIALSSLAGADVTSSRSSGGGVEPESANVNIASKSNRVVETNYIPFGKANVSSSSLSRVHADGLTASVDENAVRCSSNSDSQFRKPLSFPDGATVSHVMLSHQASQESVSEHHKESSARSWAEVFEKSAGSVHGDSGINGESQKVDYFGSNDDNDFVTPEMLETLKVKIADLKRRQEQLERDQLFFIRNPITKSAESADVDRSEWKDVELTEAPEADGKTDIAAGGISVKDNNLPASERAPVVFSVDTGSQLKRCSGNDNEVQFCNLPVDSAAPLTADLRYVGTDAVRNSLGVVGIGSDNRLVAAAAEPGHTSDGQTLKTSGIVREGNLGGLRSDDVSHLQQAGLTLPSHVESAFTVVDRKRDSGVSVQSKDAVSITAVNSNHTTAVQMVDAGSRLASHDMRPTTFTPIEPQPVTSNGAESLALNGFSFPNIKAVEISGSSFDSSQIEVTSSTSSGQRTVSVSQQSAENTRQRSELVLEYCKFMSHIF